MGNGTDLMYLAGLGPNMTSPSVCSGILIAPTWLATLAECVNVSKWATVGADCGVGDERGERIQVSRHVLYPNATTTSNSSYHQLALLELQTASNHTPVSIAWTDDVTDRSSVWIRGFDTSTPTMPLVETSATVWSYDKCDRFYVDHPEHGRTLNTSMHCLRANQNLQDRGSAVMLDMKGARQLIGLTYWQSRNNSVAPAVYVRIQVAKELIQSVLEYPTPTGSTPAPTGPTPTGPTPTGNTPSATGPSTTNPNQTAPTGSTPAPTGPTPTGNTPSATGPSTTNPNQPARTGWTSQPVPNTSLPELTVVSQPPVTTSKPLPTIVSIPPGTTPPESTVVTAAPPPPTTTEIVPITIIFCPPSKKQGC